ncbi:MAG: hypothetical protein HRT98_00470 [Mycoplasmatales bacterium]|nr:hypothetical protein [Mycoplasmatales bacterium]
MNKKIKISLGAASALIVAATPVITAVSCGKKETKKRHQHVKSVEQIKRTPSVESVDAHVNLDRIIKKAKKNATQKNIDNKLIITKNGKQFFDVKNSKYIDPLYYVVSETIKEFLESISKKAFKAKVILQKLEKDNGLYNLSKNIITAIFDKKILEHKDELQTQHFSINQILTKEPESQMDMTSGLLGLAISIMAITQTPSQLISTMINSVIDESSNTIRNSGITTNELSALLSQIHGSKFSASLTFGGKTYELVKDKKIEIPQVDIVLGFISETNRNLLSKTLKSLKSLLKKHLSALKLFPEKPISEIISELISKMFENKPAPGVSKAKNIYKKTNAPGLEKAGEIIGIFLDPTFAKLSHIFKRVLTREVTPFTKGEKINKDDFDNLLKKLSEKLPIPTSLRQFINPLLSLINQMADLYQI